MTDTVRWGVLGAARIAEKVAPAINQSTHGTVHAIASRDPARTADFAERHTADVQHASYQELLDDPDVDAVYIPLPPHLHHEWTLKAAAAGKHVLCEKPLAVDVVQAREMADACRSAGVQLMDGVMWYHHPRASMMRDIIRRESLGDLRRIVSAFSFCWNPFPPPTEFRLHRQYGGGSLYDLGWYNVGLTLWMLDRLPRRVRGTADFRDDIDMSFAGWMWYDGGLRASFDCGFETVLRRWFEVAGNAGTLVCDDFTRPWQPEKVRFWTHDGSGNATTHDAHEEHPAAPIQEVCMVNDFNALVRSGELDASWPELSVRTQLLCDLLDRSARDGQALDVEP